MTSFSHPLRVLVIDDDIKLCRLVRDYLAPFGYLVTTVHNGQEGLQEARSGTYDAVILDVMLPRLDGFSVLRELRKESDVPVLMLTARGEEADRIVGLEIGADDYLPKTFSTRELLARLRAVTRRHAGAVQSGAGEGEILTIGPLTVDPGSHKACLGGETLVLTRIEFSILVSLAMAKGRVLSRSRLIEEVAGRDYEAFDRSIDVHVSALRRKLGDDPKQPRFIRTIRGVGYSLSDPDETP